jgi:glycosyltransferase involved in cell wall biosynthesis
MNPFKVIVASPVWSLNGPNVFAENLVRGLNSSGIESHIVITRPDWNDAKPLPLPGDIRLEHLRIPRHASLRLRWRTMIRYLQELAPCIYIPNYDFTHSCISPQLPETVRIVGIVHSDDPQHYEHASRLGCYWNAIVAVSPEIASQTAALDASFFSRIATIPYGVEIPTIFSQNTAARDTELRLIYAGRLVQEQKRVFDLPRIMRELIDRGVPARLTVAGSGSDRDQLMRVCDELGVRQHVAFAGTLSNARMGELLAVHDVLLLTSEFEGLPLSLLEAMGQGCIPVVTDIRSGIRELIQDGVNGYRIAVADIRAFADRLSLLQRSLELRQAMAAKAYATVSGGGYRIRDMVASYTGLFRHVIEQSEAGAYRRPVAAIVPPPSVPWPEYLPGRLQGIGHRGKRLLADTKD